MHALSSPGAAFLDRDGTINVKAPEGAYITEPDQLRLLPGAAEAIRVLNDHDVCVIVATNQRGVALGKMTEDDLAAVHRRLAELLWHAAGARVDRIYHCPHDIGRCACRKPQPGMLLEAGRDFPGIDLRRSVMIGDSQSDVEAGRAAGTHAVLLAEGGLDLHAAIQMLVEG